MSMKAQILPAIRVTLILVLVTGILYPLAMTGMAQVIFTHQANGSLVMRNGTVVGSELIGQPFSAPGYLHPRPSAAGAGYDAANSAGTNLGPSSSKLLRGVVDRENPRNSFDGVEQLAANVRWTNDLPANAPVPVDAVTRSASGLDPHISLAYAALQVPRIARQRDLAEEEVKRLVAQGTEGRTLGILGEPRVNVLRVNMALDARAPRRMEVAP